MRERAWKKALEVGVVCASLRAKVVLGREDKAEDQADELLLPLRELEAFRAGEGSIGRRNDVDPYGLE